ncbi:hypothetical protein LXL04_006872 [Taraxacum kok-saghyz]
MVFQQLLPASHCTLLLYRLPYPSSPYSLLTSRKAFNSDLYRHCTLLLHRLPYEQHIASFFSIGFHSNISATSRNSASPAFNSDFRRQDAY